MKVTVTEEGLRFDAFCLQAFEAIPSKAFAKKAIKRGALLLNGVSVESARFVRLGDVVELVGTGRRPAATYERELTVLFEDEHMAVVDKPAGIPTNGVKHRTLEHALPHNLERSTLPDALERPRTVHRLDYQTQGLVLCAKTGSAHVALGRAFEERRVHKRYRALVTGRLEGSGEVTTELDGREAHTRWAAVAHTPSLTPGWVTTVDLWPLTGRTHQLRRHVAELGHPVLGDTVHTRGKCLRHNGLHLASVEVRFPHPVTQEEVRVQRDEPAKFESHRSREIRRVARRQRLLRTREMLAAHTAHDALEGEHLARCRLLAEVPGDPFARDHFEPGHFTASTFVLSPSGDELLMIFHVKLQRWLQPGGHIDPADADALAAARREVAEEAGLTDLELVGGLFDVDVHVIPARKSEPEHAHHDVRFLFRSPTREIAALDGVSDARWVPLDRVAELETDESIQRVVRKLLQTG
ncbi:MAG: NUDIX domain-containing protein [Proteobacteria bacterium]|nr:NUDIX domain-containing protein [Pseudomonadota bacterium]MCP4920340.1 NUDIX domain-containing protein [Pseudomonadota bacterium]